MKVYYLQKRKKLFIFLLIDIIFLLGTVLVTKTFAIQKPFHDMYIYTPKIFAPSSQASVRVIVKGAYSLLEVKPLSQVRVAIRLTKQNKKWSLFSGKTDTQGTVEASFQVPDIPEGQYLLHVSSSSPYGKEEKKQTVELKRQKGLLLVTDKPIYQPSQTIRIRLLALDRSSLTPLRKEQVFFEVEDAKGNKVFKKSLSTSDYGIAGTDFILADELNLGPYCIRATMANNSSEKTVMVSRYVLPKFQVIISTEKDYFLPGDLVKGSVNANYFFGKPVSKSKVSLKASTFDVAFKNFLLLEGNTDEDGSYLFEFRLPDYFVGQPLNKGDALLKLDVEITDQAEHTEKVTKTYQVSSSDLQVEVIPESGRLVPGMENTLFTLVSYPNGKTARAKVTLKLGEKEYHAESNSLGIATFNILVPQKARVQGSKPELKVTLRAEDEKGREVKVSKVLSLEEGEEHLLLRTDQAIYQGGSSMHIDVISTHTKGSVYLDITKNRQTILTKSLELSAGRASLRVALSPDHFGTLEVRAYQFLSDGNLVRDGKVIYVNPPNDLTIQVNADKNTYRPGEEATITFKVTDQDGKGTPAALGVIVVDESVYALQEIQPGLEKVYFTLEQELAKPRYEIHYPPGKFQMDRIVLNREWNADRQEAAKVLLASAEPTWETGWTVNPQLTRIQKETKRLQTIYRVLYQYARTHQPWIYNQVKGYWHYQTDLLKQMVSKKLLTEEKAKDPWGKWYIISDLEKLDPAFSFTELTSRIAAEKLTRLYSALYRYGKEQGELMEKIFRSGKDRRWNLPTEVLEILLAKGTFKTEDIVDPWGYRFVIRSLNKPRKEWYYYELRYYDIRSVGPDGRSGTADDITLPSRYYTSYRRNGKRKGIVQAMGKFLAAREKVPPPEVMEAIMEEDSARPEVRVREYFPETLLFLPSLITDKNGNGTLTLPLADSITSWRLTASANSPHGLLGSMTTGITVFQDFFVDLDLPVSLTQNDEVSVPVAIYNYLGGSQKIKLVIKEDDWFNLLSPRELTLTMEGNQISVQYFRIRVKEVGQKTLTVTAYGSDMNDAIRRSVKILPDGKEFRTAFSGRIGTRIAKQIPIPPEAIDGASTILVKIYPGIFSQVVEGLDNIFRLPHGCFEQTSSITYPNILVLEYMKRTRQITPEIQMKAEGFINLGYQRLLTFEVPGGGFEWFGKAPAHKILTAYGLMEFYDMAKVYDVDQKVIERTAHWIMDQQKKGGSWTPIKRYLDSLGKAFTNDLLRNTAYITWALLDTGFKGESTDRAIKYLWDHWQETEDAYTLALLVNALASHDRKDQRTLDLLRKIYEQRIEDQKEKTVHWEPAGSTAIGSTGKSAIIETTSLILLAFMKAGTYAPAVNGGLNYLVKEKDSFGTWHSTQATILALKALLGASGGSRQEVESNLTLTLNGKERQKIAITPETSDLLRLTDFKEFIKKGKNRVEIISDKEIDLHYQIVGRYYLPWNLVAKIPQRESPMSIELTYDRTAIEINDIIEAKVEVQYRGDKPTDMVIVDLGIPPGFTVITTDLESLKEQGIIEKFTLTGRQITLYIQSLEPGQMLSFTYQLKAKFPIKANTPKSRVYRYYNPEVASEVTPTILEVLSP